MHISNFLKIQSKKIQQYCMRDGNSSEYKTILYFSVHTYLAFKLTLHRVGHEKVAQVRSTA